MIVALHNGAPARPYFIENSDTIMSLKAMIPSKRLRRDIKLNIAVINVLRRTGCQENAEFLLFAANNIDKCMEIVESIWLMRHDLDDTGARSGGEPVSQTPELKQLLEAAEDILYPKNGDKVRYEKRDELEPWRPTIRPTTPAPVAAVVPLAAVPEALGAPTEAQIRRDADGLPPPVADEDILQNTPRKMAMHERLK